MPPAAGQPAALQGTEPEQGHLRGKGALLPGRPAHMAASRLRPALLARGGPVLTDVQAPGQLLPAVADLF